MDIHYSETYYWKTREGKRVDFSEFDYANLETAVKAIDSMRKNMVPWIFKILSFTM